MGIKRGEGYKTNDYSPNDYGKLKIHFADADGLHLCIAQKGFKTPLETTQDSSQVTCQNCKAGHKSQDWRRKYEGE